MARYGNPVAAVFNRTPKTIETNFSKLVYRISLDSILTSSLYPILVKALKLRIHF